MKTSADRLEIGTTIKQSLELIRGRPIPLAVGALLLTALDIFIELVKVQEYAASTLPTIVSIAVLYLVLRQLLRAEGLVVREGSFASYFGASLITTIIGVTGLVFLIVPGLYLMTRWSFAQPIILAEGDRAIEGMRRSWAATKPIAWKLVGFWLIYYLAFLLPLGLATVGAGLLTYDGVLSEGQNLPLTIVSSILVNSMVVAGSYFIVAAYEAIFASGAKLGEVFG